MSRKSYIALISALFLLLSVCSLTALMISLENLKRLKNYDIQYVMYLGTNSAETNTPKFSPEDSKMKAEEILFKYFDGFTIQEAKGGWRNEDGTESHEYTLVIYLSDTAKDKVYKAMDELLKVFDQSSILLQSNYTITEFYSGEK